jgi:phospholipid/cholesterol/gamma-HCH transport system substrate-binding protein
MQRYTKLQISVGAFVIAGALALAYLAFTLGGVAWHKHRYTLTARFSSVGDLKPGAAVKLAGVNVGEVKQIALVSFDGQTELSLDESVKLPDDTIASIQSAGLLGDSYVSLSPGASERVFPAGARILRTEPAVSLTELLAKYAFGSELTDSKPTPPTPAHGKSHDTTHADSADDLD